MRERERKERKKKKLLRNCSQMIFWKEVILPRHLPIQTSVSYYLTKFWVLIRGCRVNKFKHIRNGLLLVSYAHTTFSHPVRFPLVFPNRSKSCLPYFYSTLSSNGSCRILSYRLAIFVFICNIRNRSMWFWSIHIISLSFTFRICK